MSAEYADSDEMVKVIFEVVEFLTLKRADGIFGLKIGIPNEEETANPS